MIVLLANSRVITLYHIATTWFTLKQGRQLEHNPLNFLGNCGQQGDFVASFALWIATHSRRRPLRSAIPILFRTQAERFRR
jgi:hypothetical protein